MKITKSQLKQIITEALDGQASSKVELHAGLRTIATRAKIAKGLEDLDVRNNELDKIFEEALRLVEIVKNLKIVKNLDI